MTLPSHKTLADAIRVLSMDAVQQANSGHPGAPMGMADIAEVLWRDYLTHNPHNPHWANRDRFVLSNGHASMLLYSLLHLTGYKISIEDIKQFRQWNSKTPGHPEQMHTPGVETTTGPLGQGLANAVGFALSERILSQQFNRLNHDIINHYTYVFLGDGCLMEGISHEVCSLAGTFQLGKLIAFYDDNNISIDGNVSGWFTDDTEKRFTAYGWHVIAHIDGHNRESISAAIESARKQTDKPSLLMCKTTIGFGSPHKAGSHEAHGSPLGVAEIAATRDKLNWPAPAFSIPIAVQQAWNAQQKGELVEAKWNDKFSAYQAAFPELAIELKRRWQKALPKAWQSQMTQFISELQSAPANIATRQASKNVLEKIGRLLPELVGGSADLTPSNLTLWSGATPLNSNSATVEETEEQKHYYIHYGVREFGMSAITNGMALYGGLIPYSGTFLVFMDYARNAVRMAALMNAHNIFVYTHDSIGLGEDGPTHQPIEQAALLRLTPNLVTWRPCDQVETAVAWRCAIEHQQGPSALLLSRQNLQQQARDNAQLKNIARGGYILHDSSEKPALIIIATGSEVMLAMQATEQLSAEGYAIRVVSMPSTSLFDQQDIEYREIVLPKKITRRLAIEAASHDFWYKYVGLDGAIIGLTQFGASAPAEKLFQQYGFTLENIIAQARVLLTQ